MQWTLLSNSLHVRIGNKTLKSHHSPPSLDLSCNKRHKALLKTVWGGLEQNTV